jgi:hypothetical protein
MLKRTTRRRGWGAGAGLALLLALPGCGLLGGDRPVFTVSPAETARIRGEVEARLAAEPSIGAGRVKVEVQGGTVALLGAVDGFGALQCAIANAGLVRGVDNVVDKMVLRPGPPTVRCLAPRSLAASARSSPEA